MAEFSLKCSACGRIYASTGVPRLRCDADHGPALLHPEYPQQQITVHMDLPGIFKYADWLPTGDYVLAADPRDLGTPYCYRSTGLAEQLGLKHLRIAFSGYWPERRANLVTRTFKEFEVQASMGYFLQALRGQALPPFVISSAGNTANSFNRYAHALGLPLYLFVPNNGLSNLLLPFETTPKLIAVDGDYTDAIVLADQFADHAGLLRDGGVFNPGRRGGMGTVMLNAVCHPDQGSQQLYDHYFQAVGSASGAIAAWEAVERLLTDGRFGTDRTRVHIAQNAPFTPLHDAWQAGSDELLPIADADAYRDIEAVSAMVLTNRRPPYSVTGGVRDMLHTTGGATWRVSNEGLFKAARMFRSLEGVDIGPAGAVAVAALCQAIAAGEVQTDDRILLHVTGGGRAVQYSEGAVFSPQPTMQVRPGEIARVIDTIGEVPSLDTAAAAAALYPYPLQTAAVAAG